MDQSTETIWAAALHWLATTNVSLLTVLALFVVYAMREGFGMWLRSRRRGVRMHD